LRRKRRRKSSPLFIFKRSPYTLNSAGRGGESVDGLIEELEELNRTLEEMNKTLTHLTMIHLSALLFISVVLALLLLR